VTENEQQRPKPIVHRRPLPATVRQLYGTAFRCGKPECGRPLYKMNDDTGEIVLNSNVSHICARSEGGPRWDPEMTEDENRSESNLIPMCLEHAYEIDVTPDRYPAELLRKWKRVQIAARQPRCGTGRRSPPPPAGGRETAAPAARPRTASAARSEPIAHR